MKRHLLTDAEVAHYRKDGYVTPNYRLPADVHANLKREIESLIDGNATLRPEQLAGAHIKNNADTGVKGNADLLDFTRATPTSSTLSNRSSVPTSSCGAARCSRNPPATAWRSSMAPGRPVLADAPHGNRHRMDRRRCRDARERLPARHPWHARKRIAAAHHRQQGRHGAEPGPRHEEAR